MKKKIVIIGIAILLIVGGYYWYSKSKSSTGVVQYKTAVAEKKSITTSVSGSGNVTVDQLASIDPTISGTVANLAVNVGDDVKKGQLLFTIVNDNLSVSSAKAVASLQQSQNSVDSAVLQVKQAKADYRASKKDGSGATSDQKKILEDKIEIAEMGVIAAQKSYAASRVDYSNQQSIAGERKVVAPITGTVSAINVKNGDDLGKSASSSSYSAPIVIGDLATLKAEVQVNEVDISNVTLGQKVMLTFGAIDGLITSGKVEKMDALGTITQGVVSYKVIVSFDSLDKKIKPGMSVSAKIITDIKQDVIVVPNSALKTQEKATYIEVLENGSQAPVRRTIEIGVANNVETEIVSGIATGDNVVIQTIDPNAKATTATSNRGLFGGGGGLH